MVLETGLRGSVSGRIVSCGRDGSQVAQHVAELVGSQGFGRSYQAHNIRELNSEEA